MASTLKLGNGNWGVKNGSLLAYDDFGGKFRPFPFDFSRASSATVVNKAGLIETVQSGISRIDFKDDANGALLLEPQRTNRMPNSEDGTAWVLNNTTLSSLSGGLNKEYYQITSNDTASRFNVVQNNWVNLTAGTYTASVFAKKGTTDEIILTTRANFGALDHFSVFNLTSGTVVSSNGVTGSIEPYSDGWYRCAITFTNSGSYTDFASFAFGFNFNSSNTDTLFVASPQSEIGSYATSYIPTQGAISTRLADAIDQQITNLTSVQEGTFFLDFDRGLTNGTVRDGNTDGFFYRSGSSFPATNAIEIATDTDGKVRLAVRMNGFSPLYVNDTLSRYKMLIKWSGTSVNVFVNGVLEYTSTARWTATLPLQHIGYNFSFRKNVHQLLTYSTALTDAECITLTTI